MRLDSLLAMLAKLFGREEATQDSFADLFRRFQHLLHNNNVAMEIIADMDGKLCGDFVFGKQYLKDCVTKLEELVRDSAYHFSLITNNRYPELSAVIENLVTQLEVEFSDRPRVHDARKLYTFDAIAKGLEDVVGNKAFNLARLQSFPRTNVAPGFVAGVGCFRDYLAYNDLFDTITTTLEECRSGERSVESASQAIRLSILGAEVPPHVRRDVMNAAEKLANGKVDQTLFSVRSSALWEDGDLSFAGLYDSFLDVGHNELLSAYKKVLASLYNPESLEYRLRMNVFSEETAMPVLYQTMVPSRIAGVLYTLDPNRPEVPTAILSASWGLGTSVVGGEYTADSYHASRKPPHKIIKQDIGTKLQMNTPGWQGPPQDVPERLQTAPCLSASDVARIVETGLSLERYFKQPLDVEWSLDQDGRLWILQARPLQVSTVKPVSRPDPAEIEKQHRVVLADQGTIAYRGIGAGPVWNLVGDSDLNHVPPGAVLVSRTSPPSLAKAIPNASAIITDIGTATGHMATVAREFKVPTIVGTENATEKLRSNQLITVDAERNIVYEGRVEELLHHQLLKKSTFEMTPEYRLLRRLLRAIAPLSLTDPEDPEFTPQGCRTLHDVMRFMHEKAFRTLAQIGLNPRSFIRRGGKRLRSSLPLDLVLIDLGGGISDEVGSRVYVEPEEITSGPMRAIWQGLALTDAWSMEPVAMDFKGLMSSMTRTQSTEVLGNNLPNVNLAILASDYVNLSLPLGYHLTVIEATAGSGVANNSISFRFAGGVTDIVRRSRRAQLLKNILEPAGFKVSVNGDLVMARAIDLTEEQMFDDLHLMGRLIGFTRQLDVLLKSDADVATYLEKFQTWAGQWHDEQEQTKERLRE